MIFYSNMDALTFDMLKFANRLKAAGVSASPAEALSEVFETNTAALATKNDIENLELRLRTDMPAIKGEMLLMKWMLGFMVAGITSLVLNAFF